MKIHRFCLQDTHLTQDMWVQDERLVHQWLRVLRFQTGQKVVLFDGAEQEALYEITEVAKTQVRLVREAEVEPKLPKRDVYLLWSLLKKDKNDWVLQKCTELGVSHFVPMIAERSEKTGFNVERAKKIVLEAAEQCGRSNIPAVREPLLLPEAIKEMSEDVSLFVCEQGGVSGLSGITEPIGLLIGPEGGWSEVERALFGQKGVGQLNLSDFTLRAETAAITAAYTATCK